MGEDSAPDMNFSVPVDRPFYRVHIKYFNLPLDVEYFSTFDAAQGYMNRIMEDPREVDMRYSRISPPFDMDHLLKKVTYHG